MIHSTLEQTLISSEAFIDKYKKPIMYVFIAIVVLVGGYFLYRSFVSEPREAKANELMFKGQQYFASDNYEKALNGDGQGFPGFLKIAQRLRKHESRQSGTTLCRIKLCQIG